LQALMSCSAAFKSRALNACTLSLNDKIASQRCTRAAAKLLIRDEAWRIAANIAKLPILSWR
jgi:hypothetical protein